MEQAGTSSDGGGGKEGHHWPYLESVFKGGRWSGKGLNFEWPYFCQYLSELYQIFSSCVLCGYIINYKNSAHLHNLYHDYPEFHFDQACFRGKASFEKMT